MKLFIKIIGILALLCVAALVYVALSAQGTAEYLANYIKTEPARRARHEKKPELDPEPVTSQDENVTTENSNQNEKVV